MAAKAAENPAAERRTVTVRIDDPPDVCSRAKVKKASDLKAARFCEALALQNPLSQPCKERSKVMAAREKRSLSRSNRSPSIAALGRGWRFSLSPLIAATPQQPRFPSVSGNPGRNTIRHRPRNVPATEMG